MQKYNLKKNPLKETQNPSRYYNLTNLKFQHQAKISPFKNPHIKIDLLLLLLPRGLLKSLKLLYSIMNLNTISLRALVGNAKKKNPHSCSVGLKLTFEYISLVLVLGPFKKLNFNLCFFLSEVHQS